MPFIVGAIRSGTTLLRLMLDAHPDLSIPPETSFPAAAFDPEAAETGDRERFFALLTASRKWSDFKLEAAQFHDALAQLPQFNPTAGLRCFYDHYAARFGKPRVGDKSPGYLWYMTAIAAALPEARFIHVIRDGRDVLLSQQQAIRGLWSKRAKDAAQQTADWRNCIVQARHQAEGLPHYLEIRYERLLTDTTGVLQRLCQFLEMEYHPAMELYHRTAGQRLREMGARRRKEGDHQTQEERLSIFKLTEHPPDRSRIGRWRAELSEHDLLTFECMAADALEALGYSALTNAAERQRLRQTVCDASLTELDRCRRGLLREPKDARRHWQVSRAYFATGDYLREIACLRSCTQLQPDFVWYWGVLGQRLEQLEQYRDAWLALDRHARLLCPPQRPAWQGEDLSTRCLLIRRRIRDIGAELRQSCLIPEAAARSQRCLAVCEARLLPLFRRSFPGIEFLPPEGLESALQQADVEAGYETLAYWLRPDAAHFPHHKGFLRPDRNRAAHCRTRYRKRGQLLVGISWYSSNTDKTTPSLTDWGALLRVPGVRFVSLQYGNRAADLAFFRQTFGVQVYQDPHIDALTSLDDFAAQVAAVDLVISISNTTVHMSGALGIPTWVLLHYQSLLVWPFGRAGTPWYPATTLHWLRPGQQWSELLTPLCADLATLARRRRFATRWFDRASSLIARGKSTGLV